jgi:hypothetical protein
MSATLGIDARLAQRVEFQSALNPRIPIFDRLADGLLIMRIAAVEAGLAAAIAFAKLIERHAPASAPEFALGRAARKDDMGEFLDFLAHSRVGGLPQA